MKKHKTLGNALSMLTASALLLSLCVIRLRRRQRSGPRRCV